MNSLWKMQKWSFFISLSLTLLCMVAGSFVMSSPKSWGIGVFIGCFLSQWNFLVLGVALQMFFDRQKLILAFMFLFLRVVLYGLAIVYTVRLGYIVAIGFSVGVLLLVPSLFLASYFVKE